MPPAMPELDGVEHTFHDLPTGVRLHLATVGPQDAPPVLLLHGWPQHWWSWHHVIGELAGDFRLLCPDLRMTPPYDLRIDKHPGAQRFSLMLLHKLQSGDGVFGRVRRRPTTAPASPIADPADAK